MKKKCISSLIKPYEVGISTKLDNVILDDIARSSLTREHGQWWYLHDNAGHRLYLRLLKQEAHRRGIA